MNIFESEVIIFIHLKNNYSDKINVFKNETVNFFLGPGRFLDPILTLFCLAEPISSVCPKS